MLRFVLTLLLGCGSIPVMSESMQKAIDPIFAEWDSTHSPGCALALIQDGEIVYSRGYGMANLEHGVPITSDTVFYIASVSKQVVAAAISTLAQNDLISLDDNVRKYFPELPRYETTITIRHLVHHTSGLRDYFELWDLAGRRVQDVMPKNEILAMIARQKGLNHAPGEKFLYCNSGYILMAELVERVTGKTFREYTQDTFFEPLGMKNTLFHDNRDEIVPNRAIGHYRDESGFKMYIANFDLVGSGGLNTSVNELYLWDQFLYNNENNTFLNAMLSRGMLNDGTELSYAFGITVNDYRGLKTIGHTGSSFGYKTVHLHFPDAKSSVIIFSNLNTVIPINLAHQIADVWLDDHFSDEETDETASPETITLSESQIRPHEGFYRNEDDIAILSWVDGHFMLELPNASHQLDAINETTFIGSSDPGLTVTIRDTQFTLSDETTRVFERVPSIEMSADEIETYTGRFSSEELGVDYLVEHQDGMLVVRPDTNSPLTFRLTPAGDGVFVSRHGAVQIRYVNEKSFFFRRGWIRGILFAR